MESKRLLLAVACILVSTCAFAQETRPVPPADAPATTETVLAPAVRPVRLRWGINGALGYLYPAQAVDFGGAVRFGAQLTDRWGVYADFGYTFGFGFGGSFSGSSGSLSISAAGFWHLAPMVEVDFDKFFIAGGPLLAGGGWAQVVQTVDVSGAVSQYAVAAGGIMPGFDLRLGGTFGRRDIYSFLGGFTLAVDVKVLSAPVSSVSQTAGPSGGSQTVSVGDHVWAVAPMLMLGYDLR